MKPWLAIGLAVPPTALLLAMALRDQPPAAAELAGLARQLAQIEERLDRLESDPDREPLHRSEDDPGGSAMSPGFVPVADGRSDPGVAPPPSANDELERLKDSLDPFGVIRNTEDRLHDAYAVVVDPAADPWHRMKQAELLKQYDQFGESAVEAMRGLFASADDPNTQAAALAGLAGHVPADMRDEILNVLTPEVAGDEPNQSGFLRYYGIEALEPLLPDSEIEAFLTLVAENDPEPKIARRAAAALGAEIEWEPGAAAK